MCHFVLYNPKIAIGDVWTYWIRLGLFPLWKGQFPHTTIVSCKQDSLRFKLNKVTYVIMQRKCMSYLLLTSYIDL